MHNTIKKQINLLPLLGVAGMGGLGRVGHNRLIFDGGRIPETEDLVDCSEATDTTDSLPRLGVSDVSLMLSRPAKLKGARGEKN